MSSEVRFKKLLEPCHIGQLQIRNRMVMAAMGTNFAAGDGYINQRIKDYYEERAKGGVGTIVIGVACIDLAGKLITHQICIYDDRFLKGLEDLAAVVKRHGARVIIQLQHGGRYCNPERNGGNQPVAPSAIPMPGRALPRELTEAEIAHLVEQFARGAERAQKAGFDGVEIHAGHGYLIAQFLSPASNKRHDPYGGDLPNRARMLLETIEAVRAKVGKNYPIWCRLDGREFGIEGGISPDDGRETARLVEEAGTDVIDVSGYGGVNDFHFVEAPLCHMPGNLVPLAEGIKKIISIPVAAVGRISPAYAEQILRQGRADLVAMARALIADPDLPNKLASDQLEDIRPCINCYTCIHQIFMSDSMCCAVNASAGREEAFKLQPADRPKKVMIVGGGPAGMEAARIAASRGHRVKLYEKDRRLGGSLAFASVLTKENEDFMDYLVRQVGRLQVEINRGQEVMPAMIEAEKPDAIVLAVGPELAAPGIPGADQHNVITGRELRQMMTGCLGRNTARKLRFWQRVLLRGGGPFLKNIKPSTARWLMSHWMPLGKRIVIIGGDFVA
ncbi:MAG: FAD-dependent oxidoreductase, partial [Chloroflexi bacterium]|nr:FAD-dependent oxidoreductase [Chloroflexota bacterium]